MPIEADEVLDCKGLSCPMPILKLAKAMKKLEVGKVLELQATDPGSKTDVPVWCEKTGQELKDTEEEKGVFKYFILKAK